MKHEYHKLLAMMKAWHDEYGSAMVTINYSVHGDWEVEICGYSDYPKLRKLIADEANDAKVHFEQFGEVGPVSIALVYDDARGEIYLYFNGKLWLLLDESSFS